eukprot:11192703-Lingulodinium_polyedra.AAC.1
MKGRRRLRLQCTDCWHGGAHRTPTRMRPNTAASMGLTGWTASQSQTYNGRAGVSDSAGTNTCPTT